MKAKFIFIGFGFLASVPFACFNANAQEHARGAGSASPGEGEAGRHHRSDWHGGFGGGWSGFSGPTGITPSIITDALLVPSLTKVQQTKIRTIYLAYRAKSRNRMDVMSKLRGGFSRGEEQRRDVNDASKSREDKNRELAEKGVESSTSKLRRTLFMSMIKESEKFHSDILAVLDVKQKAELKDIAAKAGSPDYFNVVHYDKMNAVKSPGSSNDRPD